MNFQLPKSQHQALKDLVKIGGPAREQLLNVLRAEPQSLGVETLAERISETDTMSETVAMRILLMLQSMFAARLENELSSATFAEAIVEAITSGKIPDFKPEPSTIREVQTFLSEVLGLESFAVMVKGRS